MERLWCVADCEFMKVVIKSSESWFWLLWGEIINDLLVSKVEAKDGGELFLWWERFLIEKLNKGKWHDNYQENKLRVDGGVNLKEQKWNYEYIKNKSKKKRGWRRLLKLLLMDINAEIWCVIFFLLRINKKNERTIIWDGVLCFFCENKRASGLKYLHWWRWIYCGHLKCGWKGVAWEGENNIGATNLLWVVNW